jgi:alkylhydroperoxidase family enzyme
VRRLTKDEHLSHEFATTWPQYDLDQKTHALLAYAKKLTQEPSMIEDADIEGLRTAGWDEQGIYEATALISLFNCTGRLEAASGCRWIGYRKECSFPKRPRVSLRCRLVCEGSRRV